MQAFWLAESGVMPHLRRCVAVLLVSGCALLAFVASASAREVLYGAGAEGDGGAPSTLYMLDPSSGGALENIGPIGFSVTGLAVDPTDGRLYGSTGRQTSGGAANPGSLITIDKTTGAGTLVGDFRPDTETAGDVTFTPDGALFGWLVPDSNDLVTINKVTGAASVVGDSGISTIGSGLASSPGGILFHAALDTGNLYTINRITGAATPVATLNGTAGLQMPALSFNAAGTLFGSRLDYGTTGPRPSELTTIDTTTGAITSIGPSVNRLDAIAFDEQPELKSGRTVTFDATKAKTKTAGKEPMLAVRKGKKARFSGDVNAPENVAGCESNQTVQLQRKKPKQTSFTTFTQVQTDTAGNFSTKQKIKKTYEYRAILAGTEACDDAASASEKVKAKKKRRK